jgi:hypothetical protein
MLLRLYKSFLFILLGAILFALAGFLVSLASFIYSATELKAAMSAGTGLEVIEGIISFHLMIVAFCTMGGIVIGGLHIEMAMARWGRTLAATVAVFPGLIAGILLVFFIESLVPPFGIAHSSTNTNLLAAILLLITASVLIKPLCEWLSWSPVPEQPADGISYIKHQPLTH